MSSSRTDKPLEGGFLKDLSSRLRGRKAEKPPTIQSQNPAPPSVGVFVLPGIDVPDVHALYAACQDEIDHYNNVMPLLGEVESSKLQDFHVLAMDARRAAQAAWDGYENQILQEMAKIATARRRMEYLIVNEPRWYRRHDLLTFEESHIRDCLRLSPTSDAADFVEYLREMINYRVDQPHRYNMAGGKLHSLWKVVRACREALDRSIDKSAPRHALHFDLWLKGVTTRVPIYHALYIADGELKINDTSVFERQLQCEIHVKDTPPHTHGDETRECCYLLRRSLAGKKAFVLPAMYMDYCQARRTMWEMYSNVHDSRCFVIEISRPRARTCFHQKNIVHMQRLKEAAWLECRQSVDYALSERKELPVEIQDMIFEFLLDAEEVGRSRSVLQKGQTGQQKLILLPSLQCSQFKYVCTGGKDMQFVPTGS